MQILVMLGALLMSFNLWASGQCETLSSQQAQLAFDLIQQELKTNPIAVIDSYCESCLDDLPRPIVIDNFQIKRLENLSFSQIQINGEIIDAAYIYLNGENLAAQIGCKTIAVSRNLD